MAPHCRSWFALALTCGLAAQAPEYFKEEPVAWWKPKGELQVVGDRFREDNYSQKDFDRGGARLLLRWEPTWAWGRVVLGTRARLGTDRNALNRERYDQEPSNDLRIDRAYATLEGQGEHGYGELRVGLQDNPMLSQESLWDHDLAVLGLGYKSSTKVAFLPGMEIGLRGLAGRVQTFPSARVDLVAGQLVVQGEAGPVAWTLHGDRWQVSWDSDVHRLRPQPGSTGARQRMTFDVVGAAVKVDMVLPLEAKWNRHINADTHQDGEELQVFLGSRTRTWWPQAGYVWQRYERTGTPYPVNGDDWWFVSNAKGPRWILALPLPHRLLLQVSTLRHQWLDEHVTRSQVSLTWRFGA